MDFWPKHPAGKDLNVVRQTLRPTVVIAHWEKYKFPMVRRSVSSTRAQTDGEITPYPDGTFVMMNDPHQPGNYIPTLRGDKAAPTQLHLYIPRMAGVLKPT